MSEYVNDVLSAFAVCTVAFFGVSLAWYVLELMVYDRRYKPPKKRK